MSEVPTRLLRESLRAGTAREASSSCVDAEVLAAWFDDTLSAAERAAAEAHASNCPRCQALLSAMSRIAEPPAGSRPAHTWWRTSRARWLVPLTAAAAAVLLWVNAPRLTIDGSAPPAAAVAIDRSAAPAAAVAIDRSAAPAAASSVPPQPAVTSESRSAKSDARAREQRAAAAPTAPAPSRRGSEQQKALADAFGRTGDAPSLDAARRDEPAPQTAGVEAQPPPPAADRTSPLPGRAAAASAATPTFRRELMAKAAASPMLVRSPDPNVLWRMRTPGSVERSVDRGTTWDVQSTGVPVTLTAGAAPAAAICWLAGPAGTIVLSTDGRTWQRVAFPEPIDLTFVRASDAANASVTAVDGRSFTTADGGRTWQPSQR
jgi:hypothetical protein